MKNVFIEIGDFTKRVLAFLTDDDLMDLQKLLMANPNRGKVIKGCGGMRKVRFPDARRGKGKRSGLRLIYLYLPEVELICLVDIYDKNTLENLTPNMRKDLKRVADGIKKDLYA